MLIYQYDKNENTITFFEADLIQYKLDEKNNLIISKLKSANKDFDEKKIAELTEKGYSYNIFEEGIPSYEIKEILQKEMEENED